jgi:vancomycin resistance protein VanW
MERERRQPYRAEAARPRTRSALTLLALAVPLLACLGLTAWVLRLPAGEREIASFSTPLRGRTQSQVHNVTLALNALDRTLIAPGEEFSFNETVGPWTADRGYRKASVSYSGERILDWGGGVCQASTTLYNAALLAGIPIAERHRHHWPAPYAPPGQDAAVAHPNIDLRFRNTLDSPIRISARVAGESVLVRLYSRAQTQPLYVEREILAVNEPTTVIRARLPGSFRSPVLGQPGYDVAVYRVFADPDGRRELISRDSYPPQNRIIWE